MPLTIITPFHLPQRLLLATFAICSTSDLFSVDLLVQIVAIGYLHRRVALPNPTNHPMVVANRQVYVSSDPRRAYGPPYRYSPLPASLALEAWMQLVLVANNASERAYQGDLAVDFLQRARTASISCLRICDLSIGDAEVNTQITAFKYVYKGILPRVLIRDPCPCPEADPVYKMFCLLHVRAPSSLAYIFGYGQNSPRLSRVLRCVVIQLVYNRRPASGTTWSAI